MSKKGKFDNNFYLHSAILPLILFLLFFVLPLLATFSKALDIALLKEVFTSRYTYRILAFTIKEAILSAIVSILIAFPGAFYFANYKSKGKKLLISLSTLCFVLPSILVVLGFVIFYGNSGVLNNLLKKLFGTDEAVLKILYSFKAIILAHAFLNVPVALSLITDYYSGLSKTHEKAAALLGAKNLHIFFTITLPRLLPVILSAFILIFLFCFSSFSIILVLGGGPEFTTLEVEIYRSAKLSLKIERAAAYAILSLICNAFILLIINLINKRYSHKEEIGKSEVKPLTNKVAKTLFALYFIILLVFILGPLLSIIYRSFISTSKRFGTGFSTRQYQMLLGKVQAIGGMGPAVAAIKNSLLIGVLTAILSTGFALSITLLIANRKKALFDIIFTLPLATSSVITGLGFLIIRSFIHSKSELLGYILVILAHVIVTLPFAIKTILPARMNMNDNFLKSAYTMGASVKKTALTLEIPALAPSITKAFIFTFALSMGEVNATLLLAEGKIITLPVLLYRLIGAYNFQGACALGTILIVVTFIIFIIAFLFDKKERT